ncbi:MAG: hypothetical protein EOP61_08680 [Sphingomonadales bacterium]|nr:MAG: hypothetical protein EOP61_08680 [Sphingomonadales bacterium]
MRTLALALLLIPAPAFAQHSLMSDETAKGFVESGEALETRTEGDIDQDGEIDTVIVGRGDDTRTLKVFRTIKGEFDVDFALVGTLKLDPDPIGPATISISKGVLKVEDLTGGTTATNAIYRYRFVPGATPRMRLIGLDSTFYSRTYAHGGEETSWNLLTGDFITRELRLKAKGDLAYDKGPEKRTKRPSKPVYMEETPGLEDGI